MTQTAVKERGIIFTAWSIPKIIDRTKTQTRRTWGLEFVNQDPDAFEFVEMKGNLAIFKGPYKYVSSPIPKRLLPKLMVGRGSDVLFYINCPYGQVGDRLWVRETFFIDECRGDDIYGHHGPVVFYKATDFSLAEDLDSIKWRPSIFMPRWASRIDLEITEVRAERLQEISEEDAKAEGTEQMHRMSINLDFEFIPYRDTFIQLWDSLNAKRGYGWEANPWVWVISFKLT